MSSHLDESCMAKLSGSAHNDDNALLAMWCCIVVTYGWSFHFAQGIMVAKVLVLKVFTCYNLSADCGRTTFSTTSR